MTMMILNAWISCLQYLVMMPTNWPWRRSSVAFYFLYDYADESYFPKVKDKNAKVLLKRAM